MKAYVLHSIGNLIYEEREIPLCPPGWCLVRVKAAGICSSDIPRIFTKGTYHFPTVPGHEFSGIVESVADEENRFLLGKNVSVFPLIPCRKCPQCLQHHYEMCEHYDYLGSRRDGGFAEVAAVPVWNLLELPDGLSFAEGAMLEPLAVSLHAVKQMRLSGGENAAVVGSGMIAFAAAQWALLSGAASVTVLGRSEGKRQTAEKLPGIRYEVLDRCSTQFDAVLEAVGSNEAVEKAIPLVSGGGKLVLMGNPSSDILLRQNTYWQILRRQLHLVGTWNSGYESGRECDWSEAVSALADHRIRLDALVSHVFPQERLPEALAIMREHREPYCKIMTLWNRV